MLNILEKLRGGDLRTIGCANEIVHEIQENPALFESVFRGLTDNDAAIKMRSADIVEKVTRDNPALLSGYTQQIISILKKEKQQEVCWHMAQIAPRLECNKSEKNKLIDLLKNCLLHKSKIVQVSAMESLVKLAEKNVSPKNDITDVIKKQMENGSPAVKARGRNLMQRIGKITNDKT